MDQPQHTGDMHAKKWGKYEETKTWIQVLERGLRSVIDRGVGINKGAPQHRINMYILQLQVKE